MLASLFSAGAWQLGWAETGRAPAPGFGIWLRFDAQSLTLLTPLSEIGQGTPSLLAAIAAEELGLPLDQIRIETAPVEARFNNSGTGRQVTWGSAGFRGAYGVLAPACAAARDMLLRAAAAQWGVPAGECQLVGGQVRHDASGRSGSVLALAPAAALLLPPAKPEPKPPGQWQVMGKRLPRSDIPAKTDGSAVFGIDAQPPGQLLYAAVLHAPGFGARLEDVDDQPARAMRGVRAVVRLPGAVAVVAESWWTAQQATTRLRPRWTSGPQATLDSGAYAADMRAAVAQGGERDFPARMDARLDAAACEQALAAAGQVLDQTFEFPFLAHAPLEPLGATVHLQTGGRAEVWIATQAPTDTLSAVAEALALPPGRVSLHNLPAGGGFGRRLEVDAAVEASRIAHALGPGRPVKLIRSREVDLRAGYYRPASAVRVRLGLGADGLPTALRADLAGERIEDHSAVGAVQADVPDQASSQVWLEHSYALHRLHLAFTRVDRGVPVAYWRSVGASQNGFALETCLDLAARAQRVDPLAYRRRLLAGDTPRACRVLALLDTLAQRSGWGRPLAPRHHLGVALTETSRAVCGHVVEVAVEQPGRFRIVKIWAVIDAGWVGNVDAVEAQLMGGTVWGLTATLFGEMSLREGQVQQGSFDSYRLLQLRETPPMDLHVLGNGERPAGVGEEAVPSIGPALCNALLAASGKPVTQLPLTRAGWEFVA